jgi:hypothetical protein
MNPKAEIIARMFGVPVENVRRQYAKNARQLRVMEAKARRTGLKVNGYTANELRDHANTAHLNSRS